MTRSSPWLGIGVYDDTPGSPPIALQLDAAQDLVGPAGYVVLFFWPLLGPDSRKISKEAIAARLRTAYSRNLRVIARLGWSGAMRDYADRGSNFSRYTRVAEEFANTVGQMPLPPPSLQPLLVHTGNELNACNEWKCSDADRRVLDLVTRVKEVGGFMSDTFATLSTLRAAKNGSLWLAHGSLSSWQHNGCECGTNRAVGLGRPGTTFMEQLLDRRPSIYADVRWLSSHSYPYSNSNFSTDPQSKAFKGLTYYRSELATIQRATTLPAVLTETGWARHGNDNQVSASNQATWLQRAADEIWAPDASVLSVCPFLLAGRFWQTRGWNFLACPNSSSIGPCTDRLPVYDQWKLAARNLTGRTL